MLTLFRAQLQIHLPYPTKMLVYNDILTGDQILSDAYKQEPIEGFEGLFVVRSKTVGKGGITLAGENPSAEGGDCGGDDGVEKVNNMIDSETGVGYNPGPEMKLGGFVKGVYKPWCKAVKEALVAKGIKPKAFMQSAKGAVDYLKKNWKNIEIHFGRGMDPKSFILAVWDDEANASGAQSFIFFKHALVEEKY